MILSLYWGVLLFLKIFLPFILVVTSACFIVDFLITWNPQASQLKWYSRAVTTLPTASALGISKATPPSGLSLSMRSAPSQWSTSTPFSKGEERRASFAVLSTSSARSSLSSAAASF